MSERERRIGLNEAVFRSVNERLEELNQTFSEMTGNFEIICECGDEGCSEMFSIATREYEEIRSDPTQFAVLSGHEIGDVDLILEHREAYNLVRKRAGDAARAATVTDPRS
jgi:hypothetical protein